MMTVRGLGRRGLAAGAAAGLLVARGARAADPEAVAPIQGLNAALLASMRAGKGTPFPQRFNGLAPAVDRAFDLQAVLQGAIGLKWAAIPAARQQELLAVFRQFTIASYASRFDSFEGEKLEVLPESRTVGQDQVVETRLTPASGEPVRLDYVMRRGAAGWKAVDVLLTGTISQVAVQRSDFRSLVGEDGSALLASLRQKVSTLSGGTL